MRDRAPHIYRTVTAGVANAMKLEMKPKEFMVNAKGVDIESGWVYARTISIHILKTVCNLSIDEICKCSGLKSHTIKRTTARLKGGVDLKPFQSVVDVAHKIKLPSYHGIRKNTSVKYDDAVRKISEAVGYKVTLSEIKSSTKISEIVRARRVLQWWLLERGHSLNHIAAITNKDHSSVSKAISDVREVIATEGKNGDKLMYNATQALLGVVEKKVDIEPIIDLLLSVEIGKFKAIQLIEKEYKK